VKGKGVAVVGGGWAGLAAAVELAAAGVPVTVFEAARRLGGRARGVDWHGLTVDNGQHLLIGAYTETLRLLRLVGTEALLERRPLDLSQPPGFRLRLPRLPAPLHLAAGLAAAHGLSWRDKWAAARFMTALKREGYRLTCDLPLAELLQRHGQAGRLTRLLWEPICLAALNTPLAQASAQVFCNVLRDSLGGPRAASEMLLPRGDLGRLFPEAAAAYLRSRGGEVRIQARVARIDAAADGLRLDAGTATYAAVVCAVHPAQLTGLLGGLPGAETARAQASHLRYQPIQTLWLHFAAPPGFPAPMLGLTQGPGQWAFERRDLAAGLAGVVISAEGPHLELTQAALVEAVQGQLRRALGPLPALADSLLITERRATFAASPGLVRPENRTGVPGLFLAGDYTAGDHPATLEGAVRSGVQCARLILETP